MAAGIDGVTLHLTLSVAFGPGPDVWHPLAFAAIDQVSEQAGTNMSEQGDGIRDRLTAKSEDAIGRLAQDLLENPLINGAITRALGARERAAAAQEVAMGALNIPSASDIERLTRRLRSVSQRLEGIEDALDRLEQTIASQGL